MRDYFPFTNFDFYAYVFAGLILLTCVDYVTVPAQHLLLHSDWTIVPGIIAVACGYVVGQIVGLVSTLVLEFWLFRRRSATCDQPARRGILYPPSAVLLGMEEHGKLGKRVLALCATRYSQMLPQRLVSQAVARAAEAMDTTKDEIVKKRDRETVFQFGFTIGRGSDDTCRRMDRDRREYEFSRNLSLVSLLCFGILMVWGPSVARGAPLAYLPWVALAVSLAMLARFIKYFASFHSQIIRAAALGHLVEKDRKKAEVAAEHEA